VLCITSISSLPFLWSGYANNCPTHKRPIVYSPGVTNLWIYGARPPNLVCFFDVQTDLVADSHANASWLNIDVGYRLLDVSQRRLCVVLFGDQRGSSRQTEPVLVHARGEYIQMIPPSNSLVNGATTRLQMAECQTKTPTLHRHVSVPRNPKLSCAGARNAGGKTQVN